MYPLIPQNEFDKVFLKYILKQKVFLDYAISHSGRANIPKINREDLLNYEFLTYPITLQQDFASKIESIEKQKELIAQSQGCRTDIGGQNQLIDPPLDL